MPNKTSKYVSEQIIRSSASSVRDRFRDAIGSYWEVGAWSPSGVPLPSRTPTDRPQGPRDRDRPWSGTAPDIPTTPPVGTAPSRPSVPGAASTPTFETPQRSGTTLPEGPGIEFEDRLVFRDYKLNQDRKIGVEFLSEEQDYVDDNETQTLPAREVTLKLTSRPGMFSDYEEFQDYLNDIIDSEYEFFEDHHFRINKPLTSAERVLVSDADTSPTSDVNIEFKYSFYNEFYEQAIQDSLRNEKQIENVYNYIYDPAWVGEHTRRGSSHTPRKVTLLLKGIDVFDDITNITMPLNESIGYQNIYVPYDRTREINEYSNLSNAWPMSVNVRMKFDIDSILPTTLNDHFLAESLIRHVAENMNPYTSYSINEQSYDGAGLSTVQVLSENIKEINVLRWFEDSLLYGTQPLPNNFIFLGDSTSGTDMAEGLRIDYCYLISFIQDLATKIESKRRSFRDILNGEEAPSEIVAYKISKIDAARPASDPIQDFWLFNTNNEVEIMDFIDTQVKYSKKYRYVVYAIKAVYGTAYSYSSPAIWTIPGGWYAKVDAVTRPTLRMYEIPIYENIGQIIEHPPVPPSIDIIPYRGVGDKMRFHMNGGTGFFVSDPITLRDRDEIFYANYRQTHELESDAPLTYKNDDAVSAFEIFRIDKHPTTYDDFKNKLRRRVSTDVNPRSPLKASSATYIESITPNKKYYYIFRALDVHDQPSLPSIVYEIEMIDDGATVFPIIRAVDFLSDYEIEQRNKMPIRSFRKLIYIAPRFSHSYFNVSDSDMDSAITAKGRGPDVYLGGEDEAIWGKKYKVRLISKSTGKKIDFNFEVDHKHIETEKERN